MLWPAATLLCVIESTREIICLRLIQLKPALRFRPLSDKIIAK